MKLAEVGKVNFTLSGGAVLSRSTGTGASIGVSHAAGTGVDRKSVFLSRLIAVALASRVSATGAASLRGTDTGRRVSLAASHCK